MDFLAPASVVNPGGKAVPKAFPPCIELPGVLFGVRTRERRRSICGVRSVSASVPSSSERSQRFRAALMIDSSPEM